MILSTVIYNSQTLFPEDFDFAVCSVNVSSYTVGRGHDPAGHFLVCVTEKTTLRQLIRRFILLWQGTKSCCPAASVKVLLLLTGFGLSLTPPYYF